MKYFLIFCASIFQIEGARADILFLDLNFAPAEIVSATHAAKVRGENLLVFPERTANQQQEINKAYRESQRLLEKWTACQKTSRPGKCESAFQIYLEKTKEVQALADKLKKIDGEELQRILIRFKNENILLSSVVFSGHSGGMGSFSGLFGSLSMEEIQRAIQNVPNVLENVNSIYLWGCYSGTLYSLNDVWRKTFPNSKVIAGYQYRAPLGIRDSSGILLKSALLKEQALVNAGSLQKTHKIFRGLNLVADLDGTAIVGDFYLSYDEANLVDEMLKRCASFNPELLTKFDCFENGNSGCENPPADHQGPLRQLYSFLQVNRHCVEKLRVTYPNLPSLEYIIRLIFLDNVKMNFHEHHKHSFAGFNKLLVDANYPRELQLESFQRSTRADDLALISQKNAENLKNGSRDGTLINKDYWKSVYQIDRTFSQLGLILGPSWMRGSVGYHCVPFSWVEPGANESDTCGFGDALVNPLPLELEDNFVREYFAVRRTVFVSDLPSPVTMPATELDKLKSDYLARLSESILRFSELKDRSPLEEQRLEKSIAHQRLVEQMDDLGIARLIINNFELELKNLDGEIELAKETAHSASAQSMLESTKKFRADELAKLRKLIGE